VPVGSAYFGKPASVELTEDEFSHSDPPTLSFFHDSKILQKLETVNNTEFPSAFTRIFSLRSFHRGQLQTAIEALRAEYDKVPRSATIDETKLLHGLEVLSLDLPSSIREASDIFATVNSSGLRSEPEILAEYYFWKAEIFRALEKSRLAIDYYDSLRAIPYHLYLYDEATYRKAEVEEELLLTEEARLDFDSISPPIKTTAYSVLAAFRSASILRMQGNYAALESRLPIIKSLLEVTVFKSHVQDRVYHSFLDSSIQDPGLRVNHTVANHYVGFSTSYLTPFPEYYTAYYYLLKASAHSGMGKYDSAIIALSQANDAIAADSLAERYGGLTLRNYALHQIEFERGWAELSRGNNKKAAEIFSGLSKDNGGDGLSTSASHQNQGITGTFYHREDTLKVSDSPLLKSDSQIYDDIPRRAKFYQGIALFRDGKLAEAKEILTELSQDETALYSDKARYHLALTEFTAKEFIRAQALLEPIAKRRSQAGVYAAIILGDINYRRSTYAKAADYFSFALGNLSSYDTSLIALSSLERGLSLMPLNAASEAMSDLRRFVALSKPNAPGLEEALFWLGRAYLKNDSTEAARIIFKRLITEFPNTDRQIDAEYGYAWALFRNGNYQDADKSFAKVMQLDSITRYAYDALSRRGDAAYAAGAIQKAVKIYNVAIDKPTFDDYRTARSMFQLGVLRMRADSARSAINAFQYIINKVSKSDLLDRAYYNLAVAAYGIKLTDRASDAVAMLSKKYSTSAFAPRALFLQAGERDHDGDAKGAYQSYRKLISSYPDAVEFRSALFGAIESLVELDRSNDAIVLADSFYSKYSSAPFASRLLYKKAEIEFDAERYKESRKTFERFTDVYEKDTLYPNARVMIGKAIAASGGSRGEAQKIFVDVTDRYASSDAASFAYLELARLAKKDEPLRVPEYYTKAFAMNYYSSDAAPQAMLEYGRYWKESNQDSATAIFEELTKRYLLETSVGAKAQLEIVSMLLSSGNRTAAISKLENIVKAHEGDAIGISSTFQLADLQYQSGAFKKALELYKDPLEYDLTNEQLAISYIGGAKCHIKLSQKKDAIQLLRKVGSLRGISGARREQAQELLQPLLPKKKKK
jgi:TolA-binding protein